MSAIVFEKVTKNFEKNTALLATDLKINEKEFTVFLGPSGCGKTTILRLIAGLETVSSGNIFIHNKNVTWEAPKNRNVAMVFQNYALYPHMSVYENLRYPLDILKLPSAQKKEIISYTAKKLEITELLERKPSQLSGGQKQRVAIGRAAVRRPEVFLLDEPLSNLDARLRETMRSYIRSIHEQLGKTTIYVTHDQQEAMTLADRIFVFNKGRMMQSGTPQEVYQNPKNLFVAQFLGSPPINSFFAKVKGTELIGDFGRINLKNLGIKTDPQKIPEKIVFAIRPHDLKTSNSQNKGFLKAKLLSSEYLGAETYHYFQAGKENIMRYRSKTFLYKELHYKIEEVIFSILCIIEKKYFFHRNIKAIVSSFLDVRKVLLRYCEHYLLFSSLKVMISFCS